MIMTLKSTNSAMLLKKNTKTKNSVEFGLSCMSKSMSASVAMAMANDMEKGLTQIPTRNE